MYQNGSACGTAVLFFCIRAHMSPVFSLFSRLLHQIVQIQNLFPFY